MVPAQPLRSDEAMLRATPTGTTAACPNEAVQPPTTQHNHVDEYEGVFFLVGDKKQSISSLHVRTQDLSIDDQIVAFWSKDPNYADYLLLNFELAWTQGTEAEQRIRELQERGVQEA